MCSNPVSLHDLQCYISSKDPIPHIISLDLTDKADTTDSCHDDGVPRRQLAQDSNEEKPKRPGVNVVSRITSLLH